jgi:broad specificity phosphatase PhoE
MISDEDENWVMAMRWPGRASESTVAWNARRQRGWAVARRHPRPRHIIIIIHQGALSQLLR